MNPPQTSLKYCGLTVLTDIVASLKLKIDYIGFNFYPKSKRFIEPAKARRLWHEALTVFNRMEMGVPPRTKVVGIVVDMTREEIFEILRVFPEISGLQLHGQETPEDCQALRDELRPRFLWKALGIQDEEGLKCLANWSQAVDLVLFDAQENAADGQKISGGLGVAFNWKLLSASPITELLQKIPWGLAGGIQVENFLKAFGLAPGLIDVCSGIEASPGIKDLAKMQALKTMRDQLVQKA